MCSYLSWYNWYNENIENHSEFKYTFYHRWEKLTAEYWNPLFSCRNVLLSLRQISYIKGNIMHCFTRSYVSTRLCFVLESSYIPRWIKTKSHTLMWLFSTTRYKMLLTIIKILTTRIKGERNMCKSALVLKRNLKERS